MRGTLWSVSGALLLALALCAVARAEDESLLSDVEVRDAARQILADPAFDGFEHFAEPGPAVQTGETAPASTSPPGDAGRSTGSEDRTSSQGPRIPGTSSSSKSTRKDSLGTGQEPTPSGMSDPDSDPEPAPASPDAGNASEPLKSKTGTGTPAADDTARPERAAAGSLGRTAPSLRGRDGVERPVRYAPKPVKAPEPKPSTSSWTLDPMFGDFFAVIGQALGGVMHGLAYIALVVIAVLIVVLVVRALAEWWQPGRRRSGTLLASTTELADDRSPGEVPADRYLQQALELSRQQQYRQALGQLVLGAMSTIEREHWIRYRRGLTLHDYLRAVRSYPTTFAGFRELLAAYEPVEYGRREANAALFESALGGYRSGFSAAP